MDPGGYFFFHEREGGLSLARPFIIAGPDDFSYRSDCLLELNRFYQNNPIM